MIHRGNDDLKKKKRKSKSFEANFNESFLEFN